MPSQLLTARRARRTPGLKGAAAVLACLALGAAVPARGGEAGRPAHGIAMHGEPALGPGFAHLPHANPDAPKGGQLRLGAMGAFDNLNLFTFRGNLPHGLREYVVESLLARSASEPFTLYGLVAESIETPADRSSVTFRLRPQARFSDGKPITAEDVVYTRALLAEKGWPFQRSHYSKVDRAETMGPHVVRFHFKAQGDRELPLILGLMPIMARHRMNAEAVERTTLEPLVGSGPYRIERVDPGRKIVYRRDPNYWGRSLPIMRGRYNFDEVSYEYFRDQSSLFEAFKSGDLDARLEDEPSRWASAYDFPAMRNGQAQRREIPIAIPAGMSAIALNSRRAPLDDQRVRRALIHLFDAEWINRSLFHGLYRRTDSFFVRSALAASGRPADAQERALLAPFPGVVRPEILDGKPHLPAADATGTSRDSFKEANRLLEDAGFRLVNGKMVHAATGRPLNFEFLAANRTQERMALAYSENLRRLGITLRIRQVDSTQYTQRMKAFEFDLAQWTWNASLSPGNEQINRWSQRSADTQGTLNYAGVKSAAADAMIEAMLQAQTREDFTAAVRALDRVLLSGDYVIPLFHSPAQWLAWRSRVAFPATPPLTGTDFDTWWAVR